MNIFLDKSKLYPEKILIPVRSGCTGHPVLIPHKFIPQILGHADGDFGCSYLLKNKDHFVEIEVPRDTDFFDVDTISDYEKLKNKLNP